MNLRRANVQETRADKVSFTEGHVRAAQIDQPLSPDQVTQWAEWGSINYNRAKLQGDIDGVQIMQQGLSGPGPPGFEGLWSVRSPGDASWQLGKFWLRITMCAMMVFTVSPSAQHPSLCCWFISLDGPMVSRMGCKQCLQEHFIDETWEPQSKKSNKWCPETVIASMRR